MPSLFRFLVFVGLIGGLAYGAVFSLANFVKFQPREIVVTIPPNKFVKQPGAVRERASQENVTIAACSRMDSQTKARRWPAGRTHPTTA